MNTLKINHKDIKSNINIIDKYTIEYLKKKLLKETKKEFGNRLYHNDNWKIL